MGDLKLVSLADRPLPKRPKFKEGAEVTLCSGGEVMTVEASGPERTTCIWHDTSGALQEGTFDRQHVPQHSIPLAHRWPR